MMNDELTPEPLTPYYSPGSRVLFLTRRPTDALVLGAQPSSPYPVYRLKLPDGTQVNQVQERDLTPDPPAPGVEWLVYVTGDCEVLYRKKGSQSGTLCAIVWADFTWQPEGVPPKGCRLDTVLGRRFRTHRKRHADSYWPVPAALSV